MFPEIDPKQRRRLFFWTAAGALVVRLVYFVEHSQSAFFHVPILDEAFYESVTLALLAGDDVAAINPAFRPLLYPAFLALSYGLGEGGLGVGWGHPIALVTQHLLGVLTTLLVAALALRLFGRIAAGALAGAAYALAGPPLFFEGELLIATLFGFLLTLLLFVVTLGARSPLLCPLPPPEPDATGGSEGRLRQKLEAHVPAILAGLLIALAVQARANALIFLPAFLLVPWLIPFLDRQRELRREEGGTALALRASLPALQSFVIVALAAGLGLLAAAIVQEPYFGHFRILPGAGGVNLYLGNKVGADGMVPRQDQHAAYGNTYRDSVQLFSVRAYREATGDDSAEPDAGAVSRYWLGRTWAEIRNDPLSWVGLLARKSLLLLWHREIPNNKSYAFMASQEAPLLGILPMGFAGLLALAAVGAVAAWRSGRREILTWLVCFAGLHAAGVVIFFVNGRFRLPLWPLLAVLAGGGILALAQLARLAFSAGAGQSSAAGGRADTELRPGPKGGSSLLLDNLLARNLALGLGVLAVGISLVGWPGVELPPPSRDHFFRSLALFEKGDIDGARADAEQAVELEPSDPAAQFQLGTVALAQDDLAAAERHMTRATLLAPEEPRVFNNLGIVYERREKVESAYTAYQKAIQLDPHYTPTLVNLALMELRAGALRRAQKRIDLAEDLGDRSVPLQCARAFFEIHRGRVNFGRAILASAIARDSETARKLAKENAKPLILEWARLDEGED